MNSNNENRNFIGKRAGFIGILVNLLLAGGKLAIGIFSASTTIIADALNNFSDGISSVVTMLGFKIAQKPADSDHPFGHARFEYVASLIVAVMVIFVGFELAKSSIEKIITPEPIIFSLAIVIVLALSIVIKFSLAVFNFKTARRIDSDTLKAAAIDCRNDAIITTFVLIATIIEKITAVSIDGYTGLLVALFILYSGIVLTKETVSPILGRKNNTDLKQKILEKIKEYPVVIGYHDLMIHDYGPGISFCSIHFEIDKNHDPLYVHELIDKFEREFLALGVTLTVHYDPVVTDSEELNQLKHASLCCLVNIDTRLSLHDFRCIPCDGFTKVFFDIPLPDDLKNKKDELINAVSQTVNSINTKKYIAEITFESVEFN